MVFIREEAWWGGGPIALVDVFGQQTNDSNHNVVVLATDVATFVVAGEGRRSGR